MLWRVTVHYVAAPRVGGARKQVLEPQQAEIWLAGSGRFKPSRARVEQAVEHMREGGKLPRMEILSVEVAELGTVYNVGR